MVRPSNLGRKAVLIAILAMIGTFAGSMMFSGVIGENLSVLDRRPTGNPQLVSVQPLPMMEGSTCEWMAASASGNALSSYHLPQRTEAQGFAADEVSKRDPIRVIRDPYAGYSAVAVDPARGEVVLTDENLFNILVYDREENTPPLATLSEPKRMIGGLNTKIEFQCGLYIDPANGDIYAVNNDTVDTLVIFDRQAKGNVPPTRELATPHGTFGIAVDEQNKEIFLTIQHDSAVVVYDKMAEGDDAPVRLLQGNNTRLADPHGIVLDVENDLMYVTNHGSSHEVRAGLGPRTGYLNRAKGKENWPLGPNNTVPGSSKIESSSITVYERSAEGDTSPIRVIAGPRTQLNWASGIVLHPQRGELFVANDAGDSILVFQADASGDVAPIRILKGPKSGIKNPTGLSLDFENDELWVANFGNHTASVYPITAEGDRPPLRVIRSAPSGTPSLMIGNPGALAYDSNREEILVPN
jgi:DNA-binding beta-propeller fold protein YncE